MEFTIKTKGSGRKAVDAAVERFNGKLSTQQQKRGEVVVSINDDDASGFKFALEDLDVVVEYSAK